MSLASIDSTVIASIVSAVALLAGAWLTHKWKSRDPVTRASAASTMAEQQMATAGSLNAMLSAQLERQDRELKTHKAQIAKVSARLDSQHRDMNLMAGRVESLERMLSTAVSYIERLLRDMRAGHDRPTSPIPPELHDRIDPALMTWTRPGPMGIPRQDT
jgi:hypothetical protein